MNYNSFSDTSFIHPQSPPIPAQHPSLEIHIDNGDSRRSRTVSGSSLISKAPRNSLKTGGMVGGNTKNTKKSTGIDQSKILCPRARAKMDLEPKLILSESNGFHSSSVVINNIPSSHPIENSSLGIQRQIHQVKNSEFDPIREIGKYMVQCQEGIKNLQTKVTIKVSIYI